MRARFVVVVGLLLVVGACGDDADPVFTSGPGTTVSPTTDAPGTTGVATTSGETGTTAGPGTTAAPGDGPCVIPDGSIHIDFDDLAFEGPLLRPATAATEAALAADGLYVTQFDHIDHTGSGIAPITESVALIAENPAAVTPDNLGGLGTSSPPNAFRVFDDAHLSIASHQTLAGTMGYLGFNVGFGHFSEGMERPDVVDLEVTVSLVPVHEAGGGITSGSWGTVNVPLGPGPQPVEKCVYLENPGGIGHPLFETWRLDIIPRHGDGTVIHMPIDIDDLFYGCFGGSGCLTPWAGHGLDLIAHTHADHAQSFYGLYVADPATATTTPLFTTNSNRDIADPAWSPDGRWIAFTMRGTGGDSGNFVLWIISADGSTGPIQITTGSSVWGFDWHPDSRHIAYGRGAEDHNADIWVIDIWGGAPVPLTAMADGEVEPVYSPDGSRIAFEKGRRLDLIYWQSELYVMNADGSGAAPAVTTPLHAGGVNHSQSWSPDGTRLAYSSGFEDGGGVIWVVDLASGTETSVSGTAGEALFPDWSPVADRIAFFGWDTDTRVFVVNADGTTLTPVTGGISWGSGPVWSADGSTLAYFGDDTVASGSAIWVVAPSGAAPAGHVTGLPGSEYDPDWSP